jgi:HemY protein
VKLLAIIIFGLLLAFGLWWLAEQGTGFAYFQYGDTEVETTVFFVLVVALLLFAVAYFVFRFLGAMFRAPKKISQWGDEQAVKNAQVATAKGYTALIEGDFHKAERKLVAHAANHPTPVLNYIAAANAAQQRQDYKQRDRYLKNALDADPESHRAIGLTKARLQYESGQLKESHATLLALRRVAPNNPRILRLLTEVQRELGDWEGMRKTLPLSKRHAAFDADEIKALERETEQKLLTASDVSGDIASSDPKLVIANRWKKLKKKQRQDPEIIKTYVTQLIENNDMDTAERELRTALRRKWSSDLVYLYGVAKSGRPKEQLNTAKSWVQAHPRDPDLMLTLGRLAVDNEIWGEARGYFESAIAAGGRDEARSELGGLLEQLGESDQALATYRDGLAKLTGGKIHQDLLPAPEPEANPETA